MDDELTFQIKWNKLRKNTAYLKLLYMKHGPEVIKVFHAQENLHVDRINSFMELPISYLRGHR